MVDLIADPQAHAMVVICNATTGELLYASSVKTMPQVLEEIVEIHRLRAATLRVTRCAPSPWSRVPFLLNPLNLMTSAEA